MTAIDTCQKCARPMIRSRVERLTDGHVRHQAHGLCFTCYGLTRRPREAGQFRDGRRPARAVDTVAVLRLTLGDRALATTASSAELTAAVARLTARRMTAHQIAELLGCTGRTVTRYRARAAA